MSENGGMNPSLRAMMLLNKCGSYDARIWERFEALDLPAGAFVEDSAEVWEKLEITERNRTIMRQAAASGWADAELDECARIGARVVTCRDTEYPHSLSLLSRAPILLYVKGSVLPDAARTVAVVGTRGCSSYGFRTAKKIGERAAQAGWNVVSGGAKGIDGAAHLGSVDAGGLTTAVLGTGIDRVYPQENRVLFDKILERGALCSEYILGAKGESWHFPKRNRIIAGLASKIVVAEAPSRSGAMITASLAADEGREVWAVPGRIDDLRSEGTNRLIFDGAIPFVSMDAFFDTKSGYAGQEVFEGAGGEAEITEPRPDAGALTPDEKKILSILAIHGDRTIDNLADEAKMSAAEVFKIVSVMSARGFVHLSGPGRYSSSD